MTHAFPHYDNHRPPARSHHQLQCSQPPAKGSASPFDHSDTQPSSSSPNRVFSPISTPSSQSSVSDDVGFSQSQQASSQHSRPSVWSGTAADWRQRRYATQHPALNAGSKAEIHPRRTQARPSWVKPTLMRQDQRRQQLVEQLVDAATQLVALIWPESDATKAYQNRVISLRFFIRETLRRSRTSYSTLQVALWYLVMIKPYVVESFAQSDDEASSDEAPAATRTVPGQGPFGGHDACKPLQCGRRMFLSALILASKFLQDRNFTARAWSKITGLATQEIISNEFLYLNKIAWSLNLKEQDFASWNSIIIRCTESTQLGRNVRDTWSTVLESIVEQKLSLQETARVLALKHQQPVSFSAGGPSLADLVNEPTEASSPMASFNFPAHASPYSVHNMAASSSPLVSNEPSRASTPSNAGVACKLGTPTSLEAIADSDSPAWTRHPVEDENARRFQRTRAVYGMLTPSPSAVGADRPDEELRTVYPSQGPPAVHPGSGGSAVPSNMVTPSARNMSFNASSVHCAPHAQAMRALSAQQACATQSMTGPGRIRVPMHKLSQAEFYAAFRQEYLRQKHERLIQNGLPQAPKRGLTDATESRPTKALCLGTAVTAPCMATPIAGAPSLRRI